jgi:Protein of unknown function (DUF3396)
MVELAEIFLSKLLFSGTRPSTLWTKRAGMDAKLNMGDFSTSRWKTTQKKTLRGDYAVVHIVAATPDFPNQQIWLSLHVNPSGGDELLMAGTIEVKCSVSYLRHLAASPQKVEALFELSTKAWNGIPGGPAYGYGHLAMTLARPRFVPRFPQPPGAPMPWDYIKPPEERVHAIPIAYVGNDIEGNLGSLYCNGRGIKGAFWANFLSTIYVEMAGGEATLREKLSGMQLHRLNHGGLLVVATDSPLPDDQDATSERFSRLHRTLQPAYLSREETPGNKRGMLGYFYRECSDMI